MKVLVTGAKLGGEANAFSESVTQLRAIRLKTDAALSGCDFWKERFR